MRRTIAGLAAAGLVTAVAAAGAHAQTIRIHDGRDTSAQQELVGVRVTYENMASVAMRFSSNYFLHGEVPVHNLVRHQSEEPRTGVCALRALRLGVQGQGVARRPSTRGRLLRDRCAQRRQACLANHRQRQMLRRRHRPDPGQRRRLGQVEPQPLRDRLRAGQASMVGAGGAALSHHGANVLSLGPRGSRAAGRRVRGAVSRVGPAGRRARSRARWAACRRTGRTTR